MNWRRWFGDLPLRERSLALLISFASLFGVVLLTWLISALCSIPFAHRDLLRQTATSLLSAPAILGLYAFLAIVFDHKHEFAFADLGLPLIARARRLFAQGLALGFVMILICRIAICFGAGVVNTIRINAHTLGVFALLFVMLLAAASVEELIFRGYTFHKLTEAFGPLGAILVLSALFGAMHFGNPNNGGLYSWEFLNTLTVGALFAIAVLRTKSLWLPIGLHFSWNFTLGVIFGLPVSGIHSFSVLMRSETNGPRWLTGGAYGLEGSLTGAIVILAAFPVLYWLTREPSAQTNEDLVAATQNTLPEAQRDV